MKLKITSIADLGAAEKERLVFKVLADTDVGEFGVFRTRERSGTVTTGVLDAFWFPDKKVAAGDLVVLYSKAGARSEKTLEGGNTAHFFYWGAEGTMWEKGMAAVVFHVDEWNSYLAYKSK
jgi:hypothetical protein